MFNKLDAYIDKIWVDKERATLIRLSTNDLNNFDKVYDFIQKQCPKTPYDEIVKRVLNEDALYVRFAEKISATIITLGVI